VPCPVCGATDLEVFASSARVGEELAARERFFADRIDGHVDPAELKDRTDVLHATAAAIRVCPRCRLLVRDDDGRAFEGDPYAPWMMEKILRGQIDAFRQKERWLRALVPVGAHVIEVGSYVGAFLHVAHEWGWTATGVDVGADTARFASAHSYPTLRGALEELAFEAKSFDAVFIWNCFEQVENPRALLCESRRIVRDGGVLVIRTPNAEFYERSRELPDDLRLRALAWSNLLAFPHRYGFTFDALDRLAIECGFEPIDHRGDDHIPPTRERLTGTARKEEEETKRELAEFVPPWIEVVFGTAGSAD
jgi:SAM-dependent methyltransferase